MKRKRVVVLGATGSIGESARKLRATFLSGWKLSASRRTRTRAKLAEQANAFRPEAVCLVDESKLRELRANLKYQPKIFAGETGLREIACLANAEMVLVAVVGTGGLRPALAAIEAGKDLAVASKEIFVMAGEIVMRKAREKGCGCCRLIASTTRFFNVFKVDGALVPNVKRKSLTFQST